jgi:hypothetical protein
MIHLREKYNVNNDYLFCTRVSEVVKLKIEDSQVRGIIKEIIVHSLCHSFAIHPCKNVM